MADLPKAVDRSVPESPENPARKSGNSQGRLDGAKGISRQLSSNEAGSEAADLPTMSASHNANPLALLAELHFARRAETLDTNRSRIVQGQAEVSLTLGGPEAPGI
jgi:hypothetical protein